VSYETGMKAHALFTTTYIHTVPRDAVLPSMRKTGAKGRVRHQMIGAMQDPANGFRRIHLPRTRLNKLMMHLETSPRVSGYLKRKLPEMSTKNLVPCSLCPCR
jgi:hypothetical protein